MEFEWHEEKNEANIQKHGFDFSDAYQVFEAPHVVFPSSKGDEERFGAVGLLNGYCVVVIYTVRQLKHRIISIRRARPDERRQLSQLYP
jgi:uncharacterized protein